MDPLIESLQNPKIKEAVKLRDRKSRDEKGLFLIEGYRELKRAVDSGRKIHTLFYCPEFFLGTNEDDLMSKCKAAIHNPENGSHCRGPHEECKAAIHNPENGSHCRGPHEECKAALHLKCTKAVFEKISYRDRPDGLLAISPEVHLKLTDLKLKANPFLLVAESIEKPGNLGTILRSCDAAGVDGVIVADPTTDIHNPNVVRSSVGTLFTLPVVESDSESTIAYLKKHKIAIAAASPHAKLNFVEADFKVPLAIVVGTEQYGLTETWMKQADIIVRIPMLGVADSLNVASATTLLLYEAVRQRHSLLR